MILLIEDNKADAGLVREALEEQSVVGEILVITDGDRAIHYIDELERRPQECPDLMIIDLNLPRRSGQEVLKTIRSSHHCHNTIVVVLSSSDMPRDREESLSLGASRYIRKPLRLEEFLSLGALFKNLLTGRTL